MLLVFIAGLWGPKVADGGGDYKPWPAARLAVVQRMFCRLCEVFE